jgi:hypothetical protein
MLFSSETMGLKNEWYSHVECTLLRRKDWRKVCRTDHLKEEGEVRSGDVHVIIQHVSPLGKNEAWKMKTGRTDQCEKLTN